MTRAVPLVANSTAHSTGLNDPRLQQEWFAIAWSREITPGKPHARRFMGRDVVLWRSTESLHCWRDLCIHRGAKLSLGTVELAGPKGDCLICPCLLYTSPSPRDTR